MQATDSRARNVQRLAFACLVLLLALTCLSAYLRHSAVGLGCTPWPACYGQGEPAAIAGAMAVAGQALTGARMAHRVTATLALLLIIAIVVLCLRSKPRLQPQARLSVALLVLALALSLMGVFTPGSRLPAVAIGNLLGGFLMLALAARLVALPPPRGLGWAAGVVATLLGVHIAGGAFVSASHAGLACTDLRECLAQARAGGWDWQQLIPWREAGFAVGTPHAEGALLQALHRLGSLVVAPALAALAWLAMRRGRRTEGLWLLALLASQIALGLALGSTGLPLVPVLLHNLGTAVMLALVLRLA